MKPSSVSWESHITTNITLIFRFKNQLRIEKGIFELYGLMASHNNVKLP